MSCIIFSVFFRYLVERKGACIDLRNNNRKTPLHDAAQFSQYEIVEYLINQGTEHFPIPTFYYFTEEKTIKSEQIEFN